MNSKENKKICLEIVLEDKVTYRGSFDPSKKLLEIVQDALHASWIERSQLEEWKVTDRKGNGLSIFSKLAELRIPSQDTIYMSKKAGDVNDERALVRVEDAIEQRL